VSAADKMKILAVSGSLRASSTNSALVRTVGECADAAVEFVVFEGLDTLPHYSPELDRAAELPASVLEWRRQLASTDGVLICTPEYAFGMPGSLKNALDWVVSSGELWRKPVAALSASPSALGGEKAHAALLLTLMALEAHTVEAASLSIAFSRSKVTPEGSVKDEATLSALKNSLDALVSAARLKKSNIT